MSEAVFPVLGPLLVIALVLPGSALLARAVLFGLSQKISSSALDGYQGARYAILVLSSAVPLVWFISASLHQAETGQSTLVCAAQHAPSGDCSEAAHFSLALSAVALLVAVPRLLWDWAWLRAPQSARALAVQGRVERVIGERIGLAMLAGRVKVFEVVFAPIATIGAAVPQVILQTTFVEPLDDESLAGALYHELAHLSERDPLRYLLGWWALAINPLGAWLLSAEYGRWILGREAHCDRQAVLSGASPTALAKALLVAARPARTGLHATLGSPHVEAVKLRLGLLLAYADRVPHRRSQAPVLLTILLSLVLTAALPHAGPTHALDALHEVTERGLALMIHR